MPMSTRILQSSCGSGPDIGCIAARKTAARMYSVHVHGINRYEMCE